MANSISSAQAEALAEDFFSGLGSSKTDFQPVASLGVLIELAGKLAERAADNLLKADKIATGKGAESITVLNPERVGNTVRVDIQMLYYLQFIDQGVKGTKRGSGKFAFKNDFPGKAMTTAIRKWLIKEGLKSRNPGARKYRSITGREARRKSISETSNSVAYVIARAVKQKGIRPTKFMERAIKDTRREIKDKLGRSLRIDVINALPKKLEDA